MKKRISYYVAALVGKAMIHGMHLMKRNATNLPGEVALQLCPSLLANFQMPKHVIVVTGTNGKTTVTNLIAEKVRKRHHYQCFRRKCRYGDCLLAAGELQVKWHADR